MNGIKINNTAISILVILASLEIAILFFACPECFSGQTLGQFGDFYGGVVATIAAIIAGLLLYRTYINGKKDSDFEILKILFDHIVQAIENIQYRKKFAESGAPLNIEEFYTGLDAIYNFDEAHIKNPNSVMNHINSILDSFDNIIYMAEKTRYKYDNLKEITLKRIYYLFYSNILWPMWEWEFSRVSDPNNPGKDMDRGMLNKLKSLQGHDDSKKYIVRKYAELSIRTINFLSDEKRNLIERKPDVIQKLENLQK